MADSKPEGCGCPPTAPAVPSVGGVHHVFLTVNDLKRSRAFYGQLMPRLGYPAVWEYPGAEDSVGFMGNGGSLWLKQAATHVRRRDVLEGPRRSVRAGVPR